MLCFFIRYKKKITLLICKCIMGNPSNRKSKPKRRKIFFFTNNYNIEEHLEVVREVVRLNYTRSKIKIHQEIKALKMTTTTISLLNMAYSKLQSPNLDPSAIVQSTRTHAQSLQCFLISNAKEVGNYVIIFFG